MIMIILVWFWQVRLGLGAWCQRGASVETPNFAVETPNFAVETPNFAVVPLPLNLATFWIFWGKISKNWL